MERTVATAVHTDTLEFWERNNDKGASGSKLLEENEFSFPYAPSRLINSGDCSQTAQLNILSTLYYGIVFRWNATNMSLLLRN